MLRPVLLAAFFALPLAAQPVLLEDVPTYSAGMGQLDGPFTLLSLDGAVVVSADAAVRSDSVSGAWDIGIRGTEVIVNGGASGPGDRRGVLLGSTEAGDLGAVLARDGDGDCPRGPARIVCHGSGNGWYEYTGNGVQPLGRDLVIERPDGARYRVRFVRYVLADPDASGARPRLVTLEATPLSPAAGR